MTFTGKVIAITGAASGIGRAAAKRLASSGAKLCLADVQQHSLDELVAEIVASGGQATATVVDVRKREQVDNWIRGGRKRYGKLDGAINCAGIAGKQLLVADIQDISDEDWDMVLDVNLRGTLNALRAEIPNFNDGGAIVNVASLNGLVGGTKNAAYVASKHAVVGLTRTAARELGPRKIRVNVVCPGPIETPMLENSQKPNPSVPAAYIQASSLRRNGTAEEVADLLEFLLSGKSTYITGASHVIDGGFFCQ